MLLLQRIVQYITDVLYDWLIDWLLYVPRSEMQQLCASIFVGSKMKYVNTVVFHVPDSKDTD